MISETILNEAIKASNSDETERLKMKQDCLDYIASTISPGKKDPIYEEENRFEQEVSEANENQKIQ